MAPLTPDASPRQTRRIKQPMQEQDIVQCFCSSSGEKTCRDDIERRDELNPKSYKA
jgi:hypothetical protein